MKSKSRYDYINQPGTGASACQTSRWAVTLMDVLSMGKGVQCVAIKNSNRYKPGQRSSVLPDRGHDSEL